MPMLPQLIEFFMTRGLRQEQAETMRLQQDFLKSQTKQRNQLFKEKQQMIDYLNNFPPEWRMSAMKDPLVTSLLVAMTQQGLEGQTPQKQMITRDVAAGDIATKEMPRDLVGQLAEGQLGFGKAKDILGDLLYKKTGIGRSTDPVRTEPMLNPETNQWEMAQILRNGEIRFLGIEVPQDVDWIKTEDAQGRPIMKPAPRKMIPGESLGFRVPVKPEIRTITGPRGEKTEERFDPFTGEVISETPTGAPKGMPAETAGRLALVSGGIKELETLKNLVFNKDGTVNRANLGHAMLGTPRTKGRNIKNMLFRIIDPIMRAATGAAVPEPELKRYVASYSPTYLASDEEIMSTWEALGDFLRDYLTISDPTGELSKALGSFDKAMELPRRGIRTKPTLKMGREQQGLIKFKSGNRTYGIPINEINEFLKDHPDAIRTSQ